MTVRRPSGARLDQAVLAVADEVFAAVEGVRRSAIDAHRAAVLRGNPLAGEDVSQLRDGIQEHLRHRAGLMVGLGLIVAPDLLEDQPLHLEWWQREAEEGELSALRVDLDRRSPGFYDYESTEWFDVPRRTGRRHVVGPYVDVHGTGRYLLTFTIPVESAGCFLGVAGADVPVAWLETRLLRELGTEPPVLVVNTDGRIVFSTSPSRLTGDLMDDAEVLPRMFHQLPDLPWRLGLISSNR